MAKATKLPSGNWRVNAFVGTDENGKQIRKSFTAATKREAELMAAQYVTKKHHNDAPANKTFETAISEYIADNAKSFSPSTLRGYRSIQRNLPDDLLTASIASIDDNFLQKKINAYAVGRAPKTVENALRLIGPVLRYAHADVDTKEINKPAPKKTELYIPTHEEVSKLLEAVRETPFEMPIVFASFIGMRRGEIAALRWEDVDFQNNRIHIRRAVAWNELEKTWVEKTPKTYDSTRIVPLFAPVREYLERAEKNGERICPLAAGTITVKFPEVLQRAGVNQFRFHDLRHYFASSMLALGVPDRYAIDIMGHKDDQMLKKVYQHLMTDKKREVYSAIDDFYAARFSNKEAETEHG